MFVDGLALITTKQARRVGPHFVEIFVWDVGVEEVDALRLNDSEQIMHVAVAPRTFGHKAGLVSTVSGLLTAHR